jgi:hypothetical protein
LQGTQRITIDTNKTYKVRARIRQTAGMGRVYFGVITYDAAGNSIGNPYSGTYAYCAGYKVINVADGWQLFEGTITGTQAIDANAVTSKFFNGSVSAAPLVLFNYVTDTSGETGREVELDYLEFIDVATGQVLNSNAQISEGTNNWTLRAGRIDGTNNDSIVGIDQMINMVRTDAANDRVTQFIYDKLGRQRFSVNAEGYVSETVYDATGNVVETIQHERKLPSGTPANEMDIAAALYLVWNNDLNTSLDGITTSSLTALPDCIRYENGRLVFKNSDGTDSWLRKLTVMIRFTAWKSPRATRRPRVCCWASTTPRRAQRIDATI